MDVRELILRKMEENGEVRSSEIVEETGYSRAYINRFFRDLREEGVLTLIGKANRARYIPASEKLITMERASIKSVRRILKNTGIEEDKVFSEIRRKTGIIKGLDDNVSRILEYGFTEMLNNAIEHSGSERIKIEMHRKSRNVTFEVRDWE
jgi:DNA-binding Lrp family transcriptional regulator